MDWIYRNGQDGDSTNEQRWACFLRKLSVFRPLTAGEISHLKSIECRHGEYPAGVDIVRAGDTYGPVYILNSGWAIRYRILEDGRRQIANFILPGDFISLNATIFPTAEYHITTITPVTYTSFDPQSIVKMIKVHPELCCALFWCNAREESIILEHLSSVGRRSAYGRVAHLLVELWRRVELIGLAESCGFKMPLTQEMIGDCLGLTSVSVCRQMTKLTDEGLINCELKAERIICIRDKEGLEEAAGFSDGYLHFTEIPERTQNILAGQAV